MLEDLIKDICNTTLLEHITINSTAIMLDDLENLHDALPKLKELVLEEAYLYGDEPIDFIVKKPASHLESFVLHFCPRDDHKDGYLTEFEHTTTKWISYAGQKYSNVQRFEMIPRHHHIYRLDISNSFQQPLSTALSNMKRITCYAAGVCPLTELILNTIEKNGVILKKIILWSDRDDQMTQALQLIQTSRPTLSLEALEINRRQRFASTVMLSNALNGLPNKLEFLKNLTIHGGVYISLLVNIIQNLATLETLVFDGIKIGEEDTLSNNTIKQCQIKVLHMGASMRISSDDCMDSINRVFRFVLQSCPLLEQFRLFDAVTFMYDLHVALNLDFLEHARIRIVDINVIGFKYYISNEQGKQVKRWLCYNDDRVIEAEPTQQQYLSPQINLVWRGPVTLRLADCSFV